MFSLISVCLSVHRGPTCDHYSWYIEPHCTGPHPGPSCPDIKHAPWPSAPRHQTCVPPASDIWCLSLETCSACSFEDPFHLLELTSGGQSMYSEQAAGTTATGMLSCCNHMLISISLLSVSSWKSEKPSVLSICVCTSLCERCICQVPEIVHRKYIVLIGCCKRLQKCYWLVQYIPIQYNTWKRTALLM